MSRTTIRFTLPLNNGEHMAHDAWLMMYDRAGMLIREQEIKERGNGDLRLYVEGLPAGIYSYNIISDWMTEKSWWDNKMSLLQIYGFCT